MGITDVSRSAINATQQPAGFKGRIRRSTKPFLLPYSFHHQAEALEHFTLWWTCRGRGEIYTARFWCESWTPTNSKVVKRHRWAGGMEFVIFRHADGL
jgi:hypothetical protein